MKIGGITVKNMNKPVKTMYISNDLVTDWVPLVGMSNENTHYLGFHKMMQTFEEEVFDDISFNSKKKTVDFTLMVCKA